MKRVGIDTSISSIEGVSEILDNQNSGGGSMSLDLAFAVLLDFLTVRYGIPTNFLSRIFEGSEGDLMSSTAAKTLILTFTVDTLGSTLTPEIQGCQLDSTSKQTEMSADIKATQRSPIM